MPTGKIDCFLDTNVLIYAASEKNRDPRRAAIAEELISRTVFGVSGQTLAEFVAVARGKSLVGDDLLDQWLVFLGTCPLAPVDEGYVRAGLDLARRYGIHYYDAALLAAASYLGAPIFYTEDLNHNQVYGSVRAVNPFL
ncbi:MULTISPECIES: PIN domain-containing protein [Mesorhizobium]|uniref:Ribonuclease VapC n=1 Tax=Mesorhizobium shonense TaxID=1209948 RepID=A0ABV2I241_9HYPH|nr:MULTISPECIES: PIN domain-containing protein [unclassified Mesorhizobium]AZO26967.1 PIN domain-containing protein [Mesorhizobium sp. M1B.F.Ca.ET.045.04.1.1]RWA60108.1 MAG: PIN domain-containing protein [Mesorhizobium sp.]RWA77893.1 MAG: PIN domain-containing protein [Mesorhizobium sp.]RWB14065.1 MAG: PIN domain-containing protein [Mesorhizobium sp.]RWE01205.1 MAG: PIN domain-containing protein [Mesorhizobium sp.]